MSLLFSDGFDSYTANASNQADLKSKWGNLDWEQNAGLTGAYQPTDTYVGPTGRGGTGNYLRMHYTAQSGSFYFVERALGAQTAIIVGFALRWFRVSDTYEIGSLDTTQSAYRYDFLSFGWPETVVPHTGHRLNLGFRVLEGNYVGLYTGDDGNTWTAHEVARTPYPVIRDNVWMFFEAKFSTDGDMVMRIDGEEVWNETGLELNHHGAGYPYAYLGHIGGKGWFPGLFGFRGMFPSWRYDYDDFYIASNDGQGLTDLVGDVRVATVRPSAPGAFTEWLPFPPDTPNWATVNDVVYDDDATNVAATVVGATDTYVLEAITNPGSILAVQYTFRARRFQTDVSQIAPIMRLPSGATGIADALEVPADWNSVSLTYDSNPVTGLPWQLADLVDNQHGMRVVR